MSNKICGYIIVVALMFLIALSPAYAVSEDFGAFGSKKEINICACDMKEETITLHNTGDVTSTYIIEPQGTAGAWTSIAPNTFFLEPGDIKEIKQFIKVPCSARGAYELNTSIRTIFDFVKDLQQTLVVNNCPNVQIIPQFSGVQNECPCTPVQYRFEVVNTGNHVETYDLSVEPSSDAISLSTPILILEPGEKQSVDVFINLACGVYGEHTFTFNAKARGTDILGQTDFLLNIDKCYDYALAVASEYDTCQGVPNIIPFQIQNNADIANSYALDVQGVDWAYAENTSISAWGKEVVDTNIVLYPPLAEQEEEYTFTLDSISTRGEEFRSQPITVRNTRCHDYAYTQEALDVIACGDNEEGFLTISNVGTRNTGYALVIEGPGWLSLGSDSLMLTPQNSTAVSLLMAVPCDAVGDYPFNIYTTIEETNQTYVEQKVLTVHTKEEAYMVDIAVPAMDIGYEGGDFEAQIKNVGYRQATYSLYLESSSWITLDTGSVTLAPGENASILISAYPTEDVAGDIYAAKLVALVEAEKLEYAAGFTVGVAQESALDKYLWLLIAIGSMIVILFVVVAVILATRKKGKKASQKVVIEEKKPITIDKKEYAKSRAKKDVKVWPWIVGLLILFALAGGVYYTFNHLDDFSFFGGNETNETEDMSDITEGYTTDDSLSDDDLAALDKESQESVDVLAEPEPAAEVVAEPVEIVEDTEPAAAAETPAEPQMFTNDNIVESLITIDRSAISGSGAVLELENQTEVILPVTVFNPSDRKARLDLAAESAWFQFDRKALAIPANSSDTVNLIITPDYSVLETSDYSAEIKAVLDGKMIKYEETLALTITKKDAFMDTIWPWVIGGVVALILLILMIAAIASAAKKPRATKQERPAVKKVEKKIAKKELKKQEKSEKSLLWPILAVIILFVSLGALGYWAYQMQPETVEDTMNTVTDNTSTTTAAEEPAESVSVTPPTPVQPVEEKLTEEDISESLITIDRAAIPGQGTDMLMKESSYVVPVSIRNPTEKKAIFSINTADTSWIVFDAYKIVVGPGLTESVNMTITPDLDILEQNDYSVSVNASLYGQKIDYEENLDFVLKSSKEELSYWAYVLIALVLIALIIVLAEIVRSRKTGPNMKSSKSSSVKRPKVDGAKSNKVNSDLSDINKELADLRKSVNKKMTKMSK